MPGSFFDTNVLVYFAARESIKADVAEGLLLEGGCVTVQVLNELALVCRRRFDFSWQEVRETLAIVRSALAVYAVGVAIHEGGLRIAERYKLRLYDSMLLSAALLAECGTFWSEDLQDGMRIEGRLTIRNPFSAHA